MVFLQQTFEELAFFEAIAVAVVLGIRLGGLTALDVSTMESYGTHTLVLLRHGELEVLETLGA